ncbi:unnamed protein product, partial [Porites lobata]
MEWYDGSTNEFHKASSMDKVWSLVRMNPRTGSNQPPTPDERQIVPSWSGFHSVLFPHVERATTIGYCPLINGSSSEFSTIYTVMRNAQKMSASIGQQDAVITFDLAIYMKAKQIQWKASPEFENAVIRMGGFHIAINFLSVIGKIYAESGLEDLLVESGVYAAGSTSALLAGKQYNRGVRAHKLVVEAFFRLSWKAFEKWRALSPLSQPCSPDVLYLFHSASFSGPFNQLLDNIDKFQSKAKDAISLFEQFKQESRTKSSLFAFWDDYCTIVNILLQFIKAERTGKVI